MTLSLVDWLVIGGYFALNLAIGVYYARRARGSTTEFFLSGRNVPWWLAGTSMVATTFAADTPLVVTGMVARYGIAGNWLWWNMAASGMLTVFVYARLWRRAGVMTDVEFAELRYSGRPAAFLRGFRALYLGIPINCIVMGWVNLAMLKILQVTLGLDETGALWVLLALLIFTAFYTTLAGLWGVLVTDLVQFVLKMGMVVALAYFAVRATGGLGALEMKVRALDATAGGGSRLAFFPSTDSAWMPAITLFVYLGVSWWASWYPGAEPGGGGYVAQRIFSAKTERDGVLATLFFQVAHYAIRPWPWIITGLATVMLYPNGIGPTHDKEAAYVQAFVDLLPTPWRGVMMAGFAAAYMSTVGTQLNWGASYLVNDFYKRFINKTASEKHYVAMSRWATVFLFLASAVVAWQLDTVKGAWEFLLALGSGTGLVLILRWYWWRVNAWSEISAMIISAVVSLAAHPFIVARYPADDPRIVAVTMLVTVVISTIVWLAVTYMTAPEPDATLDAFYLRVRPGGPGWAHVSERLGLGREKTPGGALAWTNWVAGIVAVYSTLFGIGKLIFGELGAGLALLVVAAVAFAWIARSFRSETGPPAAKVPMEDRIAAD
jgi:Na+/proline symporter